MILTRQRLQTRDADAFPTVQLFLLAIVRLAEPIALTSIFPYAWALVKKFEVGNEKDAALYAGLLISSFALAEALTGMHWGSLSDRIGRKPVLLIGCFGTMMSLIMVGFSANIWTALIGRTLGGLLNGNIGVIQTMVGELVKKPEHEPRAYSVMPFVWSIGTILGPVIGGTFADPSSTFPQYFAKDGLFGVFPYLLPNLICAILLFVSIVAGYFLLEETLPSMQPQALMIPEDEVYVSEETPLMAAADAIKAPQIDLRSETYGTIQDALEHEGAQWPLKQENKKTKTFTKRILALLISLGIFSYHSMSFDHLLPILLEDDRSLIMSAFTGSIPSFSTNSTGGLGLSMSAVGIIMSINGVLALLVQGVIFPVSASYLGVHRLFILATILQPIPYLLMPLLSSLPSSLLYAGIYSVLSIRNILQIIEYPLLLILIKDATPNKKVLGKVNGASASVAAACRTLAPPLAGWLYSVGDQLGWGCVAWVASAVVAGFGAVQLYWVVRVKVAMDEECWVADAKMGGAVEGGDQRDEPVLTFSFGH